MTPHLERAIERLRRRAFHGAFLGAFLRAFAVTAAVLAVLVLTLRVGFRFERVDAAWAFAPLALTVVVAWVQARRRVPSHAATAAWLDVRSGGAGSIVAADEVSDSRWDPALDRQLAAEPALPRIDVARPLRMASLSFAFAAMAMLVPISPALVGPPTVVQEATLERIEDELAALQEQIELEPEVAAELQEALERLQQDGALADPEAAFEALDRAQDRLEQEAYERAELSQSAQGDLARAADDAMSNPEAAQAALEKSMEQLAAGGFSKDVQSALEKELGAAGVSLSPGTKLEAAAIESISKELAEKLGERSAALAKKGLLDGKALAKLGELAKLDDFEPTEHVCDENCGTKPGGKCQGLGRGWLLEGAGAGRGGVSRGRGDAEMTWGEETPGETDRFAAKTLPDARYADPENSGIIGLGAAAPPVDPQAEAAGSGAIEGSGGQSAWRRRLAPHHRDAVKTWFGPGGAERP